MIDLRNSSIYLICLFDAYEDDGIVHLTKDIEFDNFIKTIDFNLWTEIRIFRFKVKDVVDIIGEELTEDEKIAIIEHT